MYFILLQKEKNSKFVYFAVTVDYSLA